MDISQYKIKDLYTGKVVRQTTTESLCDWLTKLYATLTEQQEACITGLKISFDNSDADGIKWYGIACGLEITPVKKTRRSSK